MVELIREIERSKRILTRNGIMYSTFLEKYGICWNWYNSPRFPSKYLQRLYNALTDLEKDGLTVLKFIEMQKDQVKRKEYTELVLNFS